VELYLVTATEPTTTITATTSIEQYECVVN
jgi:hypothetical protein